MLKVSQIISTQVVSIFECENIGTVKNVLFNQNFKKVVGFVFFSDEMENDSFVLMENVYNFSNQGLLIRNLNKINYMLETGNNPMNKPVFSLSGDNLGKISEIIINKKGEVESFETTTGAIIKPSQILKIGFDICMVNLSNEKKISIGSFKPKRTFAVKNEVLENIQVKLVRLEDKSTQNIVKAASMPALPAKIKPDISQLLGKKATKTITGLNNEIVIRQHSTISKHTLDMAKLHNKTHELLLSTY